MYNKIINLNLNLKDEYISTYFLKNIKLLEIDNGNYQILYSTLSRTADLYHSNYIDYLHKCYASHFSYIISPDILWNIIIYEIGQEVILTPTIYKDIFTTKDNKFEISIPCNSEDEPLRINDILDVLKDHFPGNIDLFIPQFTTTTQSSYIANAGAFLEMCTPYYSYSMFLCGYKRVKILGTEEDWNLLINTISKLKTIFPENSNIERYFIKVSKVINDLIDAIETEDIEFFNNILTSKQCGSGSQYDVMGWILDLFIYRNKISMLENVPSLITNIPYKTYPSNTNWKLRIGLFSSIKDDDGFYIPSFSTFQLKECDIS